VLPFFSRLLTTEAPPAPQQPAARSTPRAAAQEALWEAARTGNIGRAADALAAGADVNALDTASSEGGASGRRALNYAALFNQARMVTWLVERNADVRLVNKTGFTALHHAAEKGAYNAVEALLKAGADPNAVLPSGSTPLAVARQRNYRDVVRILEPVTRK
jgi:ankyrin repeat protein